MSTITGGTVSIEDGDKAASKADQFDVSRRVRVELSFTVADGEDGAIVMQAVADIAQGEVDRRLGRPTEKVLAAAAPAKAARKAKTPPPTPPVEDEFNAPGETTGTDGVPAADTSASATDASSASAAATPGQQPTSAPTSDGPPADEEWGSGPEEAVITDADLNKAVQAKNTEINDGDRIRKLIGTYNPDKTRQFQLREIPAAQRQDFLDKLTALKKA